jgi:hypothetical protein
LTNYKFKQIWEKFDEVESEIAQKHGWSQASSINFMGNFVNLCDAVDFTVISVV